MRTWGRVYDEYGNATWVPVVTAPDGDNTLVWLTTLIQCLKLNLGESPFWASYGIPAQRSVVTQIFPDFYVALTQARFAKYFSSLIVAKEPSKTPTYRVNVTTNQGTPIETVVPV